MRLVQTCYPFCAKTNYSSTWIDAILIEDLNEPNKTNHPTVEVAKETQRFKRRPSHTGSMECKRGKRMQQKGVVCWTLSIQRTITRVVDALKRAAAVQSCQTVAKDFKSNVTHLTTTFWLCYSWERLRVICLPSFVPSPVRTLSDQASCTWTRWTKPCAVHDLV